jgi:hypothetical protein
LEFLFYFWSSQLETTKLGLINFQH